MARLIKKAGYADMQLAIYEAIKNEIQNVINNRNLDDDVDEIFNYVILAYNNRISKDNTFDGDLSTLYSIISDYEAKGKSIFERGLYA